MPSPITDQQLTDDRAVQVLSDEGAQCGVCGDEPGDRNCADCESCRREYVAALRKAGWAPQPEHDALLAEVRRLRDRVTELETYAHGCDAEGCVLPHSSWCERAKKTAAENDGCTCGQPWPGHPQPHTMQCWVVNPPRAEVEEMRRELAEVRAQIADEVIEWSGQQTGVHVPTVDEIAAMLRTPPTPA